jgi:hypothetical protein
MHPEREIGTVRKVSPRGDFAFLRRPLHGADQLFLHFQATVDAEKPPNTFRQGQCWSYLVGPGKRPGKLEAHQAVLVPVTAAASSVGKSYKNVVKKGSTDDDRPRSS